MEKYGTARQATGHNITRRKRIACLTTETTDTHSENVTLIAFPLATFVTRVRLNAMFSATWQSCFGLFSLSLMMLVATNQ